MGVKDMSISGLVAERALKQIECLITETIRRLDVLKEDFAKLWEAIKKRDDRCTKAFTDYIYDEIYDVRETLARIYEYYSQHIKKKGEKDEE